MISFSQRFGSNYASLMKLWRKLSSTSSMILIDKWCLEIIHCWNTLVLCPLSKSKKVVWNMVNLHEVPAGHFWQPSGEVTQAIIPGTYGTSDWIPRHVVIPLEELLQAMLCQVLLAKHSHASACWVSCRMRWITALCDPSFIPLFWGTSPVKSLHSSTCLILLVCNTLY